MPDARGGDLLGRLTLQLGSLGAFPTRILRLPELLVRIGEKRMRLRRFRIHFHRPTQFPQRARRIPARKSISPYFRLARK